MKGFELWILAFLLNSLWQVPLVFCAALVASRLARQAGLRMEHRVWVIALMLETALPLCQFHLNGLLLDARKLFPWLASHGAAGGETRVVFAAATTSGLSAAWAPAWIVAAIAVAYLGSLLYFAGRLAWGIWKTDLLLRRAQRISLPVEAARRFDRCGGHFGIAASTVRIASGPEISGPATVGLTRRTLLLPEGFIEKVCAEDLDAVLAHECAHLRRRDFAKNLLYGIVSLPVACHPLHSLTRARLAETRELVCDAMAVEAIMGRESYARSLLRLASMLSDRTAPRILHAIGILDANIFERRVMNLTRKTMMPGRAGCSLIAAACAVIALATCLSAVALQVDVATPPAQKDSAKTVSAKESEMSVITKVPPVYPPEAKKNKKSGTVELAVTIDKEGSPKFIRVSKSVDKDLDASALDAVKQWRWKPFLLNGNPVEVKTIIHITYTLKK